MKNEFMWTISQCLYITDEDWETMIAHAKNDGWDIDEIVEDFLAWYDDGIYYTITQEVVNAIQNELKERLEK